MKSDAKMGPNATKKWQKSGFYDYDADEHYPNLALIPKMIENKPRLMKNRENSFFYIFFKFFIRWLTIKN